MDKYRKWVMALITLFALNVNGQDSVDKSLFGTYGQMYYESYGISTKLKLYPDFTYSFSTLACLSSSYDTGRFTFQHDTVKFYSIAKEKYNKRKDYHREVLSFNNYRPIYYKGQLSINPLEVVYFIKGYCKEGLFKELPLMLNKEGEGFARVTDGFYSVVEEGYYKNWKLFNGVKFIYDTIDKCTYSQYFLNGMLVQDKIKIK